MAYQPVKKAKAGVDVIELGMNVDGDGEVGDWVCKVNGAMATRPGADEAEARSTARWLYEFCAPAKEA